MNSLILHIEPRDFSLRMTVIHNHKLTYVFEASLLFKKIKIDENVQVGADSGPWYG